MDRVVNFQAKILSIGTTAEGIGSAGKPALVLITSRRTAARISL